MMNSSLKCSIQNSMSPGGVSLKSTTPKPCRMPVNIATTARHVLTIYVAKYKSCMCLYLRMSINVYIPTLTAVGHIPLYVGCNMSRIRCIVARGRNILHKNFLLLLCHLSTNQPLISFISFSLLKSTSIMFLLFTSFCFLSNTNISLYIAIVIFAASYPVYLLRKSCSS